jgi:outer membrane protein OmpA-like peptidoglycan-associated protein
MVAALVGCAGHQSRVASSAPEAPPPAVDPVPAIYYVFFERWSADLSPDARGVIAGAARDAKRVSAHHIRIVGYTDPEGNLAANQKLAKERAQRVATALVAKGVAPWALQLAERPEVDDVKTSQGGRRVRITLE